MRRLPTRAAANAVARSKTLDRAALTANNVDIEAIVTMGNQNARLRRRVRPQTGLHVRRRLSDADIAEDLIKNYRRVDARAPTRGPG